MAVKNLPPPQEPFTEPKTGTLAYEGYQFLIALFNQAASSTQTVANGLVATGTNQATALLLSSDWNDVSTVPVGSGVLLASLQPGQSQSILNSDGNNLNVYPPPGGSIDNAGANIPFVLTAGNRETFNFFSTTNIQT